jgi:hypothetical protein
MSVVFWLFIIPIAMICVWLSEVRGLTCTDSLTHVTWAKDTPRPFVPYRQGIVNWLAPLLYRFAQVSIMVPMKEKDTHVANLTGTLSAGPQADGATHSWWQVQ